MAFLERHAMRQAGRATLEIKRSVDGRSFIPRQEVGYPFHITRPFYLGGDPQGMLTLYLQSVSGGIFADDEVHLVLRSLPGSRAHVTTQSSTIVHGTEGGRSRQHVSIEVHDGALLEYLPDPLVLFPRANLDTRVRVRMSATATVMLCDGFRAHDPAGEGSTFERIRSEVRVETIEGGLRCLDRLDLAGAELGVPAAAPRFLAHGSFVCLGPTWTTAALARLSKRLADLGDAYAGASALPNDAGVGVRLLAADGRALRAGLEAAWRFCREHVLGRAPLSRPK
jgi:urease accessory protein